MSDTILAASAPADLPADLDGHSDEALRALIGRAQQLLSERHASRQRDAADQIRRLARESGLSVAISKSRRRGRRPRAGRQAARP